MPKKIAMSLAVASAAIAGVSAAPATAQEYGRDGYYQSNRGDRHDDGDRYEQRYDERRSDHERRYENYRQQEAY